MKHLKRFNEGTVSDHRDDMSYLSDEMHRNNAKEFYLVSSNKSVEKYIIPEEFRGEFDEQHTGGDYGEYFKDTAEFIQMYASNSESGLIVMDYEIDNFILELQNAKKSEGYDCSQDA